jgi:hypothetical protein
LKNHWGGFNSCTKGTYINSFFTYGGADTILSVLGIKTSTIFDDEYVDDDGSSSKNSNAVCYQVEDENADYNRELDSEDGDDTYQGMSSTMGCTADSKFSVALFRGDTCDGNHFLETSDELTKYNRRANGIHCKKIWSLRRDGHTLNTDNRRELEGNDNNNNDDGAYQPASSAEALLMNSWACDIQIYPHGCPDPYSLKKKYLMVLTAVSNGESASKAIRNARLKTPVRFISTILLLAGLALLGGAYYIQNKSKGIMTSVYRDAEELFCVKIPMTLKYGWSVLRKCLRNCLKKRKKRKHGKKKKRRRRSSGKGKREKADKELEDDLQKIEDDDLAREHGDDAYYVEEGGGGEPTDAVL